MGRSWRDILGHEHIRLFCRRYRQDQAGTSKEQYGIQFYDSLVIAAAEANGCDIVLTEDLNDGQMYGTKDGPRHGHLADRLSGVMKMAKQV